MKNTYTKDEVLQIARDAYSLGYDYSVNMSAIDSAQSDEEENLINNNNEYLIDEFKRIHGFVPWE